MYVHVLLMAKQYSNSITYEIIYMYFFVYWYLYFLYIMYMIYACVWIEAISCSTCITFSLSYILVSKSHLKAGVAEEI